VVTSGENWIDDAPDQILIANAEEPIDSLQKKFDEGKLKVLAEMGPFYAGIKASDSSQQPYFQLAHLPLHLA